MRQQKKKLFRELKILGSTLSYHILLLVSGFLGIGAVLGWLLAKIIVAPIIKIVETVYGLVEGEGDLTQRLTVRGKSETASLSKVLTSFIEHIR